MQKRRKTGSGSHPENMFGGGTRPGCAQKKTQRIELEAAKDYNVAGPLTEAYAERRKWGQSLSSSRPRGQSTTAAIHRRKRTLPTLPTLP